ncbi:NUDIX domain-containing protein [Catellatospora bangladeshensis]|uniref:Nudix hydrolase domain-containing protein n=1 Tax=Catellatospora bangladeshensis TaxID=310355 RepID=A0A8J3NKV3_9ACTN|nr:MULTISPECIES: NUDIX hydrolase [Catellatospora]BCJ76206.1 hypothetical protein CS0771_57500 [Catellatospora sp. IY07-71]GIF84402.1 hypothetical protein Cba03nite_57510 [Catellatospora bangladeshensis]
MAAPESNSFATPRLAAGALFVDATGRPLLVKPSYKPGWEIPGGYVHEGEAPLAACRREIIEELGKDLTVARQPLVIDWAPAPDEGDKMLIIFDGGELGESDLSAMIFADGEIVDARFVDESNLADYLPTRLVNRLRLALRAKSQQRCIYAERGLES